MGNAFVDSTQVRCVTEGIYAGSIDPIWNLRPLPQGGVVTAMALRAMQDALAAPTHRLRTLHTTFAAQVADGPVTIEVDVLRRGRTMSHARAEVRNDEASRGHLTTAVFGESRRGFEFTDLEPPAERPHPDDCPSWRDPPPPDVEPFEPMPFWQHAEGRAVRGHAPWEDYEPDRAEVVSWHRFDDPPFLDDGTLDPLGLVVLADTMPGAVGEKTGRESNWFAPSIDLTVHLLAECRSPWVLMHNTARHAGDGYASADMALWDCGPGCDQAPRLVAYATQVFLFTFQP
ncbi:MAG: acyl-CoA thioesterase-like protein [Acidimicrobiales bacterium]|nr:acyl-CoA thioesterase-like protein [Acidimicrobiales bacterium]